MSIGNPSPVRQPLTIALFACAITAGTSTAAFASVDYRVWFFDDVYETYEMGDITDGSAPLLQPASWACGLKFYQPSYYRWVDGYGGTMSSANLDDDVIVWISAPGCPQGFSIVHGNQVISHVPGASYMEITVPDNAPGVPSGPRWIDENGEWPSCNGCAVADEMTDFPRRTHDVDVIVSAISTVSASLLVPKLQTGIGPTIADLSEQIANLHLAVSKEVAARRRTSLGDREGSVRTLEDAALASMTEASRRLDSCDAFARYGRIGDALIACTLGGQHLATTRSSLGMVQATFELPR